MSEAPAKWAGPGALRRGLGPAAGFLLGGLTAGGLLAFADLAAWAEVLATAGVLAAAVGAGAVLLQPGAEDALVAAAVHDLTTLTRAANEFGALKRYIESERSNLTPEQLQTARKLAREPEQPWQEGQSTANNAGDPRRLAVSLKLGNLSGPPITSRGRLDQILGLKSARRTARALRRHHRPTEATQLELAADRVELELSALLQQAKELGVAIFVEDALRLTVPPPVERPR